MEKIHGFTLTEIFEHASISTLDVSFEQFCSSPVTTLQLVGQCDAIDIMSARFQPLLPVQVKLRRTLEAQWQLEGNPAEPHRRRNTTHQSDAPMVCGHRIALAA